MKVASRILQIFRDTLLLIFSSHVNMKLLRDISIFKQLRIKELITLCKTIENKTFQAGDLIIREGDIGDFMYIIKQGEVKVFINDSQNNEIILAKLEKGRYFGEQALINKVPIRRNANIVAITAVECVRISHDHLQKALNAHEDIKSTLQLIGKREFSKKMAGQLSLLHFLPEDLIYKLDGKIIDYADQELIFSQGDEPDNVYFILAGMVEIHILKPHASPLVTRLNTGQIFGELGILEKTTRAGTALAKGPVKVLAIQAAIFQDIYQSTPKLQDALATREYLYHLPLKGTVTITQAKLLDLPSTSIEYKLTDGRKIYAAQAFDKTIFTMQDQTTSPTEIISYQRGATLKKEIGITNNKIVSILVLGQWIELSYLCGVLLEALPIENWQIELFKKTGSFATEKFQYKNNTEKICYCMNITRADIETQIQAGVIQLNALLDKTGAGQVCGGCKPRVSEMLGIMTWSFASIMNTKPLSPSVRLYRLHLRDNQFYTCLPGQFIVVSALIDAHWIQRSYTITSFSKESKYYEVAIKHEEKGYFTHWLFTQASNESLIKISPPQGNFTLNLRKKNPVVFFAAGIGITPAYAYVSAIKKEKSKRPLLIHYSAREEVDFVFIEELSKNASKHKNITLQLHLTSQKGRLKEEDIRQIILSSLKADFYICGPKSYRELIISNLKKHNIPDSRIKIEIFKPNVDF